MASQSQTNFDSIVLNTKSEELLAKVTITSAQLLAMFATPITVIPAGGAGTVIQFESAYISKPAGTAYTTGTFSGLAFKYNNGAGTQVSTTVVPAGLTDQATAVGSTVTAAATNALTPENQPLVIQALTAAPTVGNSPLYLTIRYRLFSSVTLPAST